MNADKATVIFLHRIALLASQESAGKHGKYAAIRTVSYPPRFEIVKEATSLENGWRSSAEFILLHLPRICHSRFKRQRVEVRGGKSKSKVSYTSPPGCSAGEDLDGYM
ncbi:hypothetical protein TNCT_346221 [Trichonephila clavata]|uniref:Uncharacterized protein n=1 Tax=Trichonephila clavata TaxID=2740835 RepID=A0A8X6LW83_TRICU|nr:hypothetical protein TNCT_253361 [Trichonephila clavata]GFR22269.1 hypothetical protein TNCT_346221 [Trichonephila clavata]